MSRATDPAPRGRCLAVWAATTGAAVALARLALPDLRTVGAALATGRAADLRFDELLLGLLLAGGAGLRGLAVAADDARRRRGRPRSRRHVRARRPRSAAPGAARRVRSRDRRRRRGRPAVAVPTQIHEDGSTGAAVVTGLPLPERAAATTSARPARGAPGARADRTVVVRAGDSLWSLAEADLSPGAGDARITARWRADLRRQPRRRRLGPDLIRPDQQLRLPETR